MDFVIIANQWDVHKDNPTSKHHVAMELMKKGHRVLWVVGTGMRTPSVGNGADRGRILRKIREGFRGAREEKLNNQHLSRQWREPTTNNQRPSEEPTLPDGTPPKRGMSQTACGHETAAGGGIGVAGRLWVVAPLVVPIPGNSLVRWINERIYLGSIRCASGHLGFKDSVLINFLPTIPGVHKGWNGKSVYYCVDRWRAFSEYDTGLMDKLDAECCKNADLVIASARDLEEHCRQHNENTHLVLHGVDYDHFAKAASRVTCHVSRPADLPKGLLVGFFGWLSAWVDQELIIKLARELNNQTTDYGLRTTEENSPIDQDEGVAEETTNNDSPLTINEHNGSDSVSIVLIGKADVDVSRLEAEPNIYLLGLKDYAELPDYLAHFDVGFIPFVINDLTKAVNPIKLREMLAGGCRVVSTVLPEVEQLQKTMPAAWQAEARDQKPDKGIWVAGDVDEFVVMVKDCLEKPLSDEEKQALSESMAGETWEAKVKRIIGLLE